MKFGYRDRERFWITLTVRMAFGFLFLIAAVNIFTYYDKKGAPTDAKKDLEFFQKSLNSYVEDLSKPYESTWINFKWSLWPAKKNEESQSVVALDAGLILVRSFLYAMPFIFLALSLCLLTGLLARTAMRLAAIYLVILGLGKYMTGDGVTTAQDFLYSAILCFGLYVASEDKQMRAEEDAEEYQAAPS